MFLFNKEKLDAALTLVAVHSQSLDKDAFWVIPEWPKMKNFFDIFTGFIDVL